MPPMAEKPDGRKPMMSERHFPHLGGRIVKTSIAVFICLIVCWLRGFRGITMSAEAAITAIICMQPFIRDSREYAVDRLAGTLIGSVWGLLFLLLMEIFPVLGTNRVVLYILMAVGVLITLYSAVVIRLPDTSSLAAIVFICIVIAFPDIEEPLVQAGNRIVDVLVGTGAAILVNVFRLPRSRNKNIVFFVQTKDLVPDRFSQIGPAALFRLNYLYNDGARICMISEHAPAFFTSQMALVKVNTPLIVMDGAAIFDINEDRYLFSETIPTNVSADLRTRLEKLDTGYFIYTIHRDKTCVFHHGDISEIEKKIYDQMRRSPYRSYLEGEVYDPREVVYYKIFGTQEELAKTIIALGKDAETDVKNLRFVIREQKLVPGMYALYLYSENATPANAKARLMEMLREEEPGLTEREINLESPYRDERDALHLLHQVERYYAPVTFSLSAKKK